jgi:PIN domain nuclease of toxin-antitoxin system
MMRKLLLDSHIFIWWLTEDEKLGPLTVEVIKDPRNKIYVSAATTWEISIKRSLGKIKAPKDLSKEIISEGFDELPISVFHGDQAGLLPEIHKDPFDRMLIAQAQTEGLELVTCDKAIPKYSVKCVNGNE